MKLFFLLANEDWILDHIGQEYQKYSRHDVNFEVEDKHDIYWLASGWCWKNVINKVISNPYRKVVCTVHHIVKEKLDKKDFQLRDQFVDYYHVPAEQTRRTLLEIGVPKNKIVKIGYWVNDDDWYNEKKKAEIQKCRQEFGILEDEYILSSFQRDGEGKNPLIPKLEKNPQGFVAFAERAAKTKKVKALLGSHRRDYVESELNKLGIPYVSAGLTDRATVRKMYLATYGYGCYVASGTIEGGCQQILESALMKVPCVAHRGAGMVENILPDNCRINTNEEFYTPSIEEVEQAYRNVQKYRMRRHIQENYDKFFEDIVLNEVKLDYP